MEDSRRIGAIPVRASAPTAIEPPTSVESRVGSNKSHARSELESGTIRGGRPQEYPEHADSLAKLISTDRRVHQLADTELQMILSPVTMQF